MAKTKGRKSSMSPKQGFKRAKVSPVIKRPVTGLSGKSKGGKNSKL